MSTPERLGFDDGGTGSPVTVAVHEPLETTGAPVLLTHGAGGDLDGAGLVALASGLAEHGHFVVRANLPYREAGRPLPPKAERMVRPFADIATAARERFGPGLRWIVGGRSYGGRVASMASADGLVPFAAGLVLYSYPLHPPGEPHRLRVDHWPRIAVPTLFLQGTHDPFGGADLLRDHVAELGAPAAVHAVDGGDHGLSIAAKRAADGRRHAEDEVLSRLAGPVADWATTAAPAGSR